jgi:hypothetical protein
MYIMPRRMNISAVYETAILLCRKLRYEQRAAGKLLDQQPSQLGLEGSDRARIMSFGSDAASRAAENWVELAGRVGPVGRRGRRLLDIFSFVLFLS